MGVDPVECSRCGETFDSQDDLIYHSIDAHAGAGADAGGTTRATDVDTGGADDAADGIDDETVDRLLEALDEQQSPGESLQVRYGQRFLLAAGTAVLAIVVVLSYLHLVGLLQTTVYLFSLGALFGLALSYLQAFVQAARR